MLVGVLAGVLVGIGLSLLWLISVTTRPSLPLMVRERGTQVFRELGEHADDEAEPDIAVIRIDGGLFFATADALEDRVREVSEANPGLSAIVIDCGAITIVDAQGAATLHEILALAQDHDLTVRLARVKPSVRATLARDGVVDRLGAGPAARQRAPRRRGPPGARRRVGLVPGEDLRLGLGVLDVVEVPVAVQLAQPLQAGGHVDRGLRGPRTTRWPARGGSAGTSRCRPWRR